MNIKQLMHELEVIKSVYGEDVDVCIWEYAGGDDILTNVHPRFDDNIGVLVLDGAYSFDPPIYR